MTSVQDREGLRAVHGVRLVTDAEDGSSIFSLPDGVYGFSYSPGSEEMPVFARQGNYTFEIHKTRAGEIILVGYVSEADHALLENTSGTCEIDLCPSIKADAPALVAVPWSQVERANPQSTRDKGNLKVRVTPARA